MHGGHTDDEHPVQHVPQRQVVGPQGGPPHLQPFSFLYLNLSRISRQVETLVLILASASYINNTTKENSCIMTDYIQARL